MTIAVAWDVKQQTKPKNKFIESNQKEESISKKDFTYIWQIPKSGEIAYFFLLTQDGSLILVDLHPTLQKEKMKRYI